MGFQRPTNYLKLNKEGLSEDEISYEMTSKSQYQSEQLLTGLSLKLKTAISNLDSNKTFYIIYLTQNV